MASQPETEPTQPKSDKSENSDRIDQRAQRRPSDPGEQADLLLIEPSPSPVVAQVRAAAEVAKLSLDYRSGLADGLNRIGERPHPTAVLLGPSLPGLIASARRCQQVDPLLQIAILTNRTDPTEAADGSSETLRLALRFDPGLDGICELIPVSEAGLLAHRLRALVDRGRQQRDFQKLADRLNAQLQDLAAVRPSRLIVSDRYLATLLAQATDGIISTDLDGRVVLWNLAAARLFDRTVDQALGQPFASLVSPGERDLIEDLFHQAQSGRVGRGEITVQTATGASRFLALSVAVVRDESEVPLGISILAHDVTEQRRAELALVEANQLKDEFLLVAGHELRTPVTTIKAYAQILLRHVKQAHEPAGWDRLTRILPRIDQEVNRLTRLINDLLDFGRLQAHSIELRRQRTDLVRLVEAAAARLEPQLLSQHRLRVDLPDHPIWAEIDVGRLDQALSNLLANARKFSPQGGQITITLQATDREARISVTDEGIGLPLEQRTKLFQPYFRGTNAPAKSFAGLGLGLYVTRMIVEQHGGDIWAESQGEGTGSSFHLTLPLAAPG